HRTVVIAVHYILRDVLDLSHTRGIATARDRTQRGEQVGMRHGHAPCPVRAHGVSHEIDALRVDAVVAAHLGEHVHHVLLGGPAVHGGGVASLRADHDEAPQARFALEQPVLIAVEHAVLVATHA